MIITGIMLIVFVLLQLGDIYTTHRILSYGGRELNPVMAKMFNWYGLLPTLIWIKVLAIGAVWWVDSLYLTAISCIVYAAVVANNFRVLNALQKP